MTTTKRDKDNRRRPTSQGVCPPVRFFLILLLIAVGTGAWATPTEVYHRGGSGTAWSGDDLSDWSAVTAGTTFEIDGGLKTGAGNAGYEYQKVLTTINDNARLTITGTWNTGSSLGRDAAYNYLRFGTIELRAYGQARQGSIVINGEETLLATATDDVRDNKDWTFSITVTQSTGAASYTVTLPSAGTKSGTGNAGELDFSAIKMGYLKTGSLTNTHQTLKSISISQETYAYSVNATGSISQAIASGSDGPGASLTIPYHHYIKDGTTLHMADRQGGDPHYGANFTLDTDNKSVNVTYASHATNVAVFREAEDFMTVANNTYVSNRCSNMKGGYSATAKTVASLPSGAYTITAASYGRPTDFVFSSGGTDKWTHSASAWGESSSGTVQLSEGDLQVRGGSSSYPLDYVYVQRVFAFEDASSGMTQGGSGNPTLINPTGASVSYNSSNTHVATVNASGDVSFLHNGTAVITATATIDEVVYTTAHTVNVTGETNATETWLPASPTTTETYTLSGTGYVDQTADGTLITMSYGSATETQTVVDGKAHCVDASGYSFVFLNALENATGIPTMGTYYTFVPKQNGTLKINAMVSEDGYKGRNGIRLVDADGNILEHITSIGTSYQDYTFNTLLIKGRTYYVFAETGAMKSDERPNAAYSTLWLSGFTFTKMEGTTISLIDQSLLFTPGENANSNRLDRKIPGFNITFGGGDGAKYQGSGTFIFRNRTASEETQNGSITITPRIKTGTATDVVITQVTLNTGASVVGTPSIYINDVDKGTVTANSTLTYSGLTGNTLTIKLKGSGVVDAYSFLLNSMTILYTVDPSAALDKDPVPDQIELKFANDYIYGYEGKTETCDIYFNKPGAFYGDVTFNYSNDTFSNGCSNAVTKHKNADEKVHLNDGDTTNPYKVRIGQGTGTLTAIYAGSDYFAPSSATTRLYSRDYEESKTLAADGSYTVPAGAGATITVTTSTSESATVTLTNTGEVTTTLVKDGDVFKEKAFSATVSGTTGATQAVTITNTTGEEITVKIKVARKSATLNFSYNGAVGAASDVLFSSWNYTPNAFSISGETGIASYYEDNGTYTITQPVSGVSIDEESGVLTIDDDADDGLLEVTLTVNPLEANKALYAPLTKTITLKVVSGMWDFRNYTQADNNSMAESTGWSPGNAYNVGSDFNAFTDIIRNDGTPLPLALSLQVMGKMRLLWGGKGYLHLQGRGSGVNESANGGGQVRVPVKAGMLVELNCYSEDLMSEMAITGVTDLEGNEVTSFYVNPEGATVSDDSQFFLSTVDGFVTISNPSTNLDLHIRYIKASADMAFEYGNETYIDANVGTWSNPVMNQGTTTIGYTYVNDISTPVSEISASGEVTIGSAQYGKFTVTATGSGSGVLKGKTNAYEVYVIGLTRNSTSSSAAIDGTGVHEFDLKTFFDINPGGTGLTEEVLKSKMVFSLLDDVPTATLDGSTLKIEGVQTVRVKATLGAIERIFTCEVTGGTLAGGLNPVIANDAESYTITIEGESGHTFNLKAMYDGIKGDIATDKASLHFYNDDDPESPVELVDKTVTSVNCSKLRITGFSTIKKGGVIPIYAGYTHSETPYSIEGTLTIAYNQKTWDFTPDLIATHGNLKGWTTGEGSSTAAWNSTYATIDEPTDDGARNDSYNWKFTRKINNKTSTSIVYYYNHTLEGQNALVVPETEGLHIFSSPSSKQFGVEMTKSEAPYECHDLMMLRGGKLTIPLLKKGQWVEVRWNRHTADMGERILMTNLSDAAGTPITSAYKIGNCFYNLGWGSSTYMFQATEDGDVTFEVADNIYVNIEKIILHERDWDYQSSLDVTLKGYDDLHTPTEEAKAGWATNGNAPNIDWIYLWNDDATSHTVTILSREYQNAPNAPQTWTFEMDEMLKRSGAEMVTEGVDGGEATITYNGGWGKVKVTMTSYSQNMKYVANQKSWTITFGQAPKQTYPYTWDFTKFFSATNSSMGNDVTWTFYNYDGGAANPLRIATYNNHTSMDYTANPNTYNTSDYQSYYVEGGQLVSYGLRNTNNGVIRETAGLGFKLDTDANGVPEENMLMLNMTRTVAAATQASGEQTWNTDTGETDAKKHTDNSHLTIGSGGKIIVPKPGDGATSYYIYIKSSHEPSYNSSVKKMVSEDAADATQKHDDNYDVPTDVYKYQFSTNADAEFTFESSDEAVDGVLVGRKYTDIYAIAVTKDFKTLKKLSGTGWATESRDYAVDYTLDSLFTNRPVRAYSVIARSSNPRYSDDKTKTTVSLIDRNYVVPARQGLVLKQVTGSPGADGNTYDVPLFVPAVTTATEFEYAYANNLMRPSLTGEAPGTTNSNLTFTTERCDFNGTDNAKGAYTRFILTESYKTWVKDGENPATHGDWRSGSKPGFYRFHLSETPADNILGANKAYLVLETDKINPAIWTTPSPSREINFVGIEGVSDDEVTEFNSQDSDNRTYNLRGQAVDGEQLLPGIYIRNGKKVIVK